MNACTRLRLIGGLSILALTVSACKNEPPLQGTVDAVDASTPSDTIATPTAQVRSQVLAWLNAAKAGDRNAAMACGTSEFRQLEESSGRSFTNAIWGDGLLLVEYEIYDIEIDDADAEAETAKVSASATFREPSGEDDGEGLRFTLVRTGPSAWAITTLN